MDFAGRKIRYRMTRQHGGISEGRTKRGGVLWTTLHMN